MASRHRSHATRAFNPQLHPMHAALVSRSASHMASSLRQEGRDEALAEGIADFIAHCGHDGLGLYLAAVWHWLDEREYHEAADAVQHCIETGIVPNLRPAPRMSKRRDARVT
jgi:hypothetical protein